MYTKQQDNTLQRDKDYKWETMKENYIKSKIKDIKLGKMFNLNPFNEAAIFLFLVPRNLEDNGFVDYPVLQCPPEDKTLKKLSLFSIYRDHYDSEDEITTYGYYDNPNDIISFLKLERDGNISVVDKTLLLNNNVNIPYILNTIYNFLTEKLKLLEELKYNPPYYIFLSFDSIKDKYYYYKDNHSIEHSKPSINKELFIKFKIDSYNKDIKQNYLSYVSNIFVNNFEMHSDVYNNFIKSKLSYL
jgi:hypothetical protein